MKAVAILLVAALVMLNGCGTSSTPTQTAVGGTWSATLLGGEGAASGFSFTAQFTVSGAGGTLTVSSFQFLTAGSCFPVNGENPSGSMTLTFNPTTYEVNGTLNSFTVSSGGNSLVLNGTVTGTEPGGPNGTTLTGGMIVGTWALTGSQGCTVPSSSDTSFTMTQVAGS
jgi:hypothetical protein